MVLGPLDRRLIRKRCQACARRRGKCDGGSPCNYCSKKNMRCVPQVTSPQATQFTNTQGEKEPQNAVALIQAPVNVSEALETKFIRSFFRDFLLRNDFACASLDSNTITFGFQNAPSLYHASVAIGALSMAQMSQEDSKRAKVVALSSYCTSIKSLRSDIVELRVNCDISGLWTTLFLGLFELMYDESGEGWVKHVLDGTSKILQLRGPGNHTSGPGRSFFLTSRVFEICRSLIYNEPSFLFEPAWMSLTEGMWEGQLAAQWHPKESLFDLMILCSALGMRVVEFLKTEESDHTVAARNALSAFAVDGWNIREQLESWYTAFDIWKSIAPTSQPDPQSVIAETYYHGISIYLSGIFDYRPQFNTLDCPRLPFVRVQDHVVGILSGAQLALTHTNISGVLTFFPLRVAGARAVNSVQKEIILSLLRQISSRKFIVARAFETDLDELWNSKSP